MRACSAPGDIRRLPERFGLHTRLGDSWAVPDLCLTRHPEYLEQQCRANAVPVDGMSVALRLRQAQERAGATDEGPEPDSLTAACKA